MSNKKKLKKPLGDRTRDFFKTKRGKGVLTGFGILSTGLLIWGGYDIYNARKEVGVDNTVVTTQGNVKMRDYTVLATRPRGDKPSDSGYKYLFEAPIFKNKGLTGASEKEKAKNEFGGTENFLKTLVELASTGDSGDLNSAVALFTRNDENYKFTEDDNLVALATGRDFQIYNNYVEQASGMTTNGEKQVLKKYGQFVNNTGFKSPHSGAIILSQLPLDSLALIVRDNRSSIVDKPVYYESATQIKTVEEAARYAVGASMYADSATVNKTLEAWENTPGINSLYQITLSERTNPDRLIYAIFTEDKSGRLTPYGIYEREANDNTRYVFEFNGQVNQVDRFSEDDISWQGLKDYLEGNY